jgi:hypothetical protein
MKRMRSRIGNLSSWTFLRAITGGPTCRVALNRLCRTVFTRSFFVLSNHDHAITAWSSIEYLSARCRPVRQPHYIDAWTLENATLLGCESRLFDRTRGSTGSVGEPYLKGMRVLSQACPDAPLEPIQEVRIHEQGDDLVKRRSMRRIMARRMKAATVRA